MSFERYKKGGESYTLGAFPTIELLEKKPEWVTKVLCHPKYKRREELEERCQKAQIPLEGGERILRRIGKESTLVAGLFRPDPEKVKPGCHVLLDEPRDMGNLGTIMRTMVGLGYRDLVILGTSADPFHPKTVRASMGAIFTLRLSRFETLKEYQRAFGHNRLYPFMLDPKARSPRGIREEENFSLLFGNEARGLDPSVALLGIPLQIPQSEAVDSLNLTTAVAIGLYEAREWKAFLEDRRAKGDKE